MNIEVETVMNRDEQMVYMWDGRGYYCYVDGKGVWSSERVPVCRIPGPVIIEIQRRLGIENPKGIFAATDPDMWVSIVGRRSP